jgi:molybdopterin-containing oxidoreductase family iron-sulfur binding subunit
MPTPEHTHDHEHDHAADGATGLDRRDFLRLVGFSLGAASLASCSRGPVQAALSLMDPSEAVVAGRDYWIATTSWADGAGCGVLARCIDGRPIKLEGNPGHPVGDGGLTPSVQAALLSLYDSRRSDGPTLAGEGTTWFLADAALRERLDALRAGGGRLRVLTPTLTGPSTRAWIGKLLDSVPDGRHVQYDALSCSALLDAWQAARGVRVLPRYDLSKARVLAAFDADLLGTWVSAAEHARAWGRARRPDGEAPAMSRHWQFESRLSLTGSRADRRVPLAPWETALALALLGGDLAGRAGSALPGPLPDTSSLSEPVRTAIADLAQELWDHRGESLVVCGGNDPDSQLLTCWISELLQSEGATLHLQRPSLQRQGDDRALQTLLEELLADEVDVLIVAGGNPAYELPGFAEALARAGTLVCTSPQPDETSGLAAMVFPEPHELERWDDAEPHTGLYATSQPTLPALRDTRTLRASLAAWLGEPADERALLVAHWRDVLESRRPDRVEPFERWFERVLERGWVELSSPHEHAPDSFNRQAVADALVRTGARSPEAGGVPQGSSLGLVLYPKVGLLDGRGAHNPWLQELPDPIAKTVWDNHADLAPATAERLGLETGDVVTLAAEDGTRLTLPVLVQPGQHEGVVAVALGYGRLGTDRFTRVGPEWLESRPTVEPGGLVGVNAAPLLLLQDGALRCDRRTVTIARTGGRHELAITQDYHSLTVPPHLAPAGGEVRDALRTVSFPALLADPAGALGGHHAAAAHGDLWAKDHERKGHHWAMSVDLSACTGCSACVVSCQAENNVPVVGRDEVRRHREMSWLRIDRYYGESVSGELRVGHQPMMCQHCDHAPCETVCPVLATVHSSEGLNQQVYNRCVGTRYCANNCPYKVRRFNWFDYARDDTLQNLGLNPEITVRSRGVMEKCSLCVQRIQASKAAASRDGRALADGEVRTACQQSCPTEAIVFGDLNDPESAVSRLLARPRAYEVLGELNVQPSVRYLADVRNAEDAGGGHG